MVFNATFNNISVILRLKNLATFHIIDINLGILVAIYFDESKRQF
jgi:hypothetical protein